MISKYLGFDSDYLIIGLAALVVLLIIFMIVNIVQMRKLKKNYKIFMTGKDAQTLEDTLIKRLDEVDSLIEANEQNAKNISTLFHNMEFAYQKIGLVKYDAFNEMGGKLSFSLALLDKKNNGFLINAMHTREGCYTYIKEIIDGNSVIVLSQEEQEALDSAVGVKNTVEQVNNVSAQEKKKKKKDKAQTETDGIEEINIAK